MKNLQIKTVVAFLCLITLNLAANEKNTTVTHNALQNKIDTFLTDGIENGFSGYVVVKVNDKTLLSKGYGMANKATKASITEDTIFDLGSNTKQFTGAGIMKLVELGKLNLKQPLSDFFKDIPIDKQSITIHELLTHTSGLIELIDNDFAHISEKKFFQQVFASPLKFKPGNRFSYSNIGYSILAKIIQITSTLSYESFLNKYFFAPLQMTQTGYLLPKWNPDSIAHGYPRNIVDVGSMVERYKDDKKVSWHLMGNGGVNSTASDMLKWIDALKSNSVLSKHSFNTMITLYNPIKHYEDGSQLGSGYGWATKLTKFKQLRLSHNGSNSRFAHSIVWYPNSDNLILFATNADSIELERVAIQIDKSIQSKNYKFIPIRKNAYQYIFDVIAVQQPKYIIELIKYLQTHYEYKIKSPDLLNRIGLMLLDQENFDWAIAILNANCQLFPTDGNLHDSLGEAFFKAGLYELAAKSFDKAIDLGAEDDCHWCKNSQAKLLEIKGHI